MKSELIQQAALEVAHQKTTAGMIASSVAAAATSAVDSINPYIPMAALCLTFLFGFANVWINYKKYLLEKEKKDED